MAYSPEEFMSATYVDAPTDINRLLLNLPTTTSVMLVIRTDTGRKCGWLQGRVTDGTQQNVKQITIGNGNILNYPVPRAQGVTLEC